MADLAGGTILQEGMYSGMTDHRDAGMYTPTETVFQSNTDHRADAGVYGFQGGGTVTYWYKLRVRDDGVGPPAVYRVWTSTDPASSPPGAPPVGSWVDRTVLDVWTL